MAAGPSRPGRAFGTLRPGRQRHDGKLKGGDDDAGASRTALELTAGDPMHLAAVGPAQPISDVVDTSFTYGAWVAT